MGINVEKYLGWRKRECTNKKENKMEKELKCPKCKSILVDVEDCYDIVTCEEGLKELYIGYCMNCGAEFQWSELYKLVGYNDFEEV